MSQSVRVRDYIRRNIIGIVALYVALGGISWAAALASNSVKSKHIKDGQVKTNDLAAGAVTDVKLADGSVVTAKIVDNAVTGAKVDESTLAQVPSAQQADNATNATNAGNADTLDTLDSTDFQLRVGGTCPADSSIREIAADGTVTCETDTGGGAPSGPAGGDLGGTYPDPSIANNAVGTNEIQNGTVGSADIDSSQVQARVSGTCPVNGAVQSINASGGVVCGGTAPSGPAGGDLTGSTYPGPTIAPGVVNSSKVQDNSLTGTDIDETSLSFPGTIQAFTGFGVSPIPIGPNFQFVGGTTTVTVPAGGGRLTVTGSAPMWLASGGPEPVHHNVCFQSTVAGSPVLEVGGGQFQVAELSTAHNTYASSFSLGSVGAGTYNVGFCIRKTAGAGVLHDFGIGWAMVTR